MKMKKRASLREVKTNAKEMLKLKKMFGNQITQKMKEFDEDANDGEIDEEFD